MVHGMGMGMMIMIAFRKTGQFSPALGLIPLAFAPCCSSEMTALLHWQLV